MAEGGNTWDFNCPQFYDFCDGVEDNTINIQSLGGNSPALENKFNLKSKNLMKNRFGAWNSKYLNYPTMSTPVNKSPFVNVNRLTNTTDSEKINKKKKRLSRSEGCVNTVGTCVNILKREESHGPVYTRKRSMSDGDVRPKKKFPATPKKIPATPMCLKRTQRKDKAKKLKTTEELELEKIAELQSLTRKHLRLNEMNMKKLKLKPKPLNVPKPGPSNEEKKEKIVPVKQFQKDLDDAIKRLNSKKNMRFTVSNRLERLNAITSESELASSSHALQPSVSDQLDEDQMAVDENTILDEVQYSNSFHSSRHGNRNYNKENLDLKAPKSDTGLIKKSFKF